MVKSIKKVLTAAVLSLTAFGFAFMPVANAALDPAMKALLQSLGLSSAQITQVSAMLGGGSSSSSMVSSGYNHTVTLRTGASGAQVIALQEALNFCYNAALVADGSFGPATKAAVMSAQAELGLAVDGVVGPNTGSKLSSCSVDGGDNMMDDDNDDEDEDDDVDFESGGGDEVTFDEEDYDDASDDDLEEGQEMATIAEIEFVPEDSDVLLERLDLVFEFRGAADNGVDDGDDTDPWDVFETLYILVDGDEVADMDLDDDDDWDESNYGTFNYADTDNTRIRLKGLDIPLDADEMVNMEFAVDIASSVDVGTNDLSEWSVWLPIDSMRFLDEAGITQYLPDAEQEFQFTIEEKGGDDDMSFSSSSNDPDAAVLEVDDNGTSDEYHIFSFEVEADEDGADLDIDEVQVTISVTNPTGGEDPITAATVISEVRLEIDGTSEDYTGTPGGWTTNIADGATQAVTFEFDFDNNVTIDSGDEVEAKLYVEFESRGETGSENYDDGTIIQASIDDDDTDNWDVEGADKLADGQKTGAATGDQHQLFAEGIDVEMGDVDIQTTTNDSGEIISVTYEIEVEVTAFGTTFYIGKDAEELGAEAGEAFVFTIEDASDNDESGNLAYSTAVTTSGADTVGSGWRIDDGDTETFTLTVDLNTYNPGAGLGSEFIRIQLDQVNFDDDSGLGSEDTIDLEPTEDFETQVQKINDTTA